MSGDGRATFCALSLEDAETPPGERLRRPVHAFIRSECEEAQVRVALADAAPLYRDAPEAQAAKSAGSGIIEAFLLELLPDVSVETRANAGELIKTTLSTDGKQFSETPRTPAEIEAYAAAMADMFCAYLESLKA